MWYIPVIERRRTELDKTFVSNTIIQHNDTSALQLHRDGSQVINDSSHDAGESETQDVTLHGRSPRTDGDEIAGARMDEIQLFVGKPGGMVPLGVVLARERKGTDPKSFGEIVIFPSAVVAKVSSSTIFWLSGHPLLKRWFAE